MEDPDARRRRLVKNLRRKVRVSRRFDVEPMEGNREKHTCRECQKSEIVKIAPDRCDPKLIQRISAYRSRGGITGVCRNCSRLRAAELYPLPDDGVKKTPKDPKS